MVICLKKFYSDTPVLQISSSMVYGTWEGVIDEQYSLGSENPYGVSKIKAETLCGENDVILRPIHIYGMGDGKFSIWMNLERQIAAKKTFFSIGSWLHLYRRFCFSNQKYFRQLATGHL